MLLNRLLFLIVCLCLATFTPRIAAQCTYSLSAQVTDVSCFGAHDGAIDLSVGGGVGPFSYEWPDGQQTEDAVGLGPGVYVVTVTDGLGCISNLAREVKTPTAITVDAYGGTINCLYPSVALTASAQGGLGQYLYFWSNGAFGSNVFTGTPGTYHVTVTDGNGCSQSTQVTVSIDTVAPVADAGPDKHFDCQTPQLQLGGPGSSTGADITYNWSGPGIQTGANGNANDQFPIVSKSGIYTLHVEKLNGCSAVDHVFAMGPPPPLISAGADIGLPCGGGQMTLSGSATVTGTYTKLWTSFGGGSIVSGANTLNPVVDQGGYYVLIVTQNSTGCEKRDTVRVFPGPIVNAADIDILDVSCTGQLGAVFYGPTDGVPPYTYEWSNGSTNQSLVNVAPGIYELKVTDGAGCERYGEFTVGQGTPFFTLSHTSADPTCPSANDGSIDLTVGGLIQPPLTYAWSNGATTEDQSGLTAGTYTVTVTDFTTCTLTRSIVLGGPSAFTLDGTVSPHISCGNPDGAIDLNVTPPGSYVYIWMTGAATQDISGLTAGTYTVTVFNAGCSKTASFVIAPPPPIVLSGVATDVSCNGQCNGKIQLTVSGGTPPLEYFWSPGNTTQSIANMCSGVYIVTVYDAGFCSATKTFMINDQPLITLDVVTTNANCNQADGTIDLTVTGGVPPFTYEWSNNHYLQDCPHTPGGTYTVTVTDQNGCTQTGTAVVGQNSAINLSLSTTAAHCFPACDGTITLTVTNGTPPYTYKWSNGSTNKNQNNLCAGTYTVTVTDVTGCSETSSAVVTQNSSINVAFNQQNASCFSSNDGWIDLTVTGGAPPYLYQWSSSATSQDQSALSAGTYTVTVTDQNFCTQITSVTIGQPSAISINANIINADCSGGATGAIDLTVSGGTPAYTYLWNNNAITQDLNGLPAGTYTVTVTDASLCTKTASATVGQSSTIIISANVINVNCSSGATGAIDLTVSGGTPAYTYLWNNNAITQDLNGLPAGTYTVTVTDASLCTQTKTMVVSQSSSINITVNKNDVACFGGSSGQVDITATGGNPPYTYFWSNALTVEDLIGMTVGTYTVTVTDQNFCTQTTSVTIGQPTAISTSTDITDVLCNGGINGAINLTVAGGVGPITYDWMHIPGVNNPQDVSNLSAGTYTVTVTDANSCTKIVSATVNEPLLFNISFQTYPAGCGGQANGGIDIMVFGGTPSYVYHWSNGANTQNITNLTAGTYTVTVTDLVGCVKIGSATVGQPVNMNLSELVTQVQCFGEANGSIDLSVSGGAAPFTYQWNTGANTQDLADIPAGAYTVTVTDMNDCTASSLVTVTEPASMAFNIVSLSNTCSSETLTGPIGPNLVYMWTGPGIVSATTTAVTVYNSGVYTLVITNPTGCTASSSYTVNLSGNSTCGAIKGRIFHDTDESCSLNGTEPGLAGWIVRAVSSTDTVYDVTDSQGRYLMAVPLGTYTLKVILPNLLWNVCPGGAPVNVTVGDTIAGGDFPVQAVYTCPALTVNIGTERLRRCSSNNSYEVEYCNLGTQTATNAYVTVVLDPFLTLMSATVPYVDLGSNVFQVNVGDLSIGECGSFSMQVFVGCNAALGRTHCSSASIYPDSLCSPVDALWSGASLQVKSLCDNDSVRFVMKNAGNGTMATGANYIVVEDGIMFRQGVLPPLAEGDSMNLSFPANGSTWRVEVRQEPYHPYPAPVGLSVEGCTVNANFSTGFVNQFPLPDETPALDIDCRANVSAYDPNDKQSYPLGYGAEHFIRPGTDLEYQIRFQNTGTDTAFRVEIIDTLSGLLDPETIRFGPSSHDYRYDLDGNGVAHFIFENILLPDSNTNEPASHGYAKFAVKPRSDAPLGVRIENTAAIYFDQNDPVFTNTTFHVLGENFIKVGLWEPQKPEIQIIVSPNPFNESTWLSLKDFEESTALTLQVFDLRGQMVREMNGDRYGFQLKKEDWQAGMYGFRIISEGRLIGSGKLVVE